MNKEKKVSEIMTSSIISVNVDDRLGKVMEIFGGHDIHHIIVRSASGLAGVISKSDILKLYQSHHDRKETVDFSRMKASEIMTAHPLTLESNDTIGLAADIILSNKLHSLPVVDDGELSGILTSHDLLRCAYEL